MLGRTCIHKAARWATRRHATTTTTPVGNGVVGIRRENKGRWERRVPLTPQAVQTLVQDGVKVVVQPSNLRIFPDTAYATAGATIDEDLTACGTVLGVKEVPIEEMLGDKTYVYFSHTIKAQEYNMKALDALKQKNIRLLDYEVITNASGERLVKFGRFAGLAGMVDILHGLGNRLLAKGFATPFVQTGLSYQYPSLGHAKASINAAGKQMQAAGIPRELGPMVVVFTGDGAVSRGAQEIFQELPHKFVTAAELPALVKSGGDAGTFYGCVVDCPDYCQHTGGRDFDFAHYLKHPSEYTSHFHQTISPHASVIVNAGYWDAKFPRMVTTEQEKELAIAGKTRLLALSDISADPQGSVEWMSKCSTIDEPFWYYDPATETTHSDVYGSGVLVNSVDNLPTEFPTEASEHFSEKLAPLLKNLATASVETDLLPELHRALMTSGGQMTPAYKYVDGLRGARHHNQRRVLLIGAGLVAAPVVDYLCRDPTNFVTVASRTKAKGEAMTAKHTNAAAIALTVDELEKMRTHVKASDLVISLVPWTHHVPIAELCIQTKTNMVTASYVSPAMKALDAAALEADITILNEIGVDPGIDHLTAKRTIDEVQDRGGKITSFVSWCGGLPAPEASNNALGYKFSWSPRGVLLAGLNVAKYMEDGEVIETKGGELFGTARNVDIYPGYSLEGVPNRDSIPYIESYGIPHTKNMFRGSLRYRGFCRLMVAFNRLGYFSLGTDARLGPAGADMTWRDLACALAEAPAGSDYEALKGAVLSKAGVTDAYEQRRMLDAMQSLGLLSNEMVPKAGTVLDAVSSLFEGKMQFQEGERDMVIMQHVFGIEHSDGAKERRTSTLIEYGNPDGYTAMAKTVGIPTGVAAQLVLDGTITRKGVLQPVHKDVYLPILDKLEQEEKISMVDESMSIEE